MRGWGLMLAMVAAGCSKATGPAATTLTGQWKGTIGAFGIGFITMNLTENGGGDVRGTGTWTPDVGSGSGTLTVTGLHIGVELQINLIVNYPDGPKDTVLPGAVTGPDAFYLVFPTEPPRRITFTR